MQFHGILKNYVYFTLFDCFNFDDDRHSSKLPIALFNINFACSECNLKRIGLRPAHRTMR